VCPWLGATTGDIFLSEDGDDHSDCADPRTACRTLRRAAQVADVGRAVVYVDAGGRRSASGWLCREEVVQVRGTITLKPMPTAAASASSGTARLGCGASGGGGGGRRVLLFNVSGTPGGGGEASLTVERLAVEGVILQVRDGHVAVVDAALVDVSLMAVDRPRHVGLDVINSTWSCRSPNLTTCEVGVSTDDD